MAQELLKAHYRDFSMGREREFLHDRSRAS